MCSLEFLAQPRLPLGDSLAQDAYFLDAVAAGSNPRQPVLRVYETDGDWLALGRYHFAPPQRKGDRGPRLYRRHSGGRALPFGEGFVGVALVLPHRSALVSPDPFALAPHQVLNRYVRGILEACKQLGVEAFYPGRDVVTCGGRILSAISLEVDDRGATLFEAILSVDRDFSVLPALLDVADREGVIKAEMPAPDQMTCIARELGRSVDFEKLAEALRQGYERSFQRTLETHTLVPTERSAINAIAADRFSGDRWLSQRQLPSGRWRYASTRGQLGTFEVYIDLADDRLRAVRFAGDFIANSPAVDQLEDGLRSCVPHWRAVDAVVSRVFARPENFMLGIGKLHTIADTLMRAVGT
jgi:lipoate-protein ligase A